MSHTSTDYERRLTDLWQQLTGKWQGAGADNFARDAALPMAQAAGDFHLSLLGFDEAEAALDEALSAIIREINEI